MTDNEHRSAVRAVAVLIPEWQHTCHVAKAKVNETPGNAA